MKGIRVNMLCPYFIDTPLIPLVAKVILAGGATGKPEDVVDAGTRLMADTRIVGRALAVGPKIKTSVDDPWKLVPHTDATGKDVAIWETYADDFEDVDLFVKKFVTLLNQVEATRGWMGWASDILAAFVYPVRVWIGR